MSYIKIVTTCHDKAYESEVEIISSNVDVFIMLVYHWRYTSSHVHITTSDGTFSIGSCWENLPQQEKTRMLFAHAFSGSQTTGSIYGKGKLSLYQKLTKEEVFEELFQSYLDLTWRAPALHKF